MKTNEPNWIKIVNNVRSRLRRKFRGWIDDDELLGAAQIGVMLAYNSFDAEKNDNLSAWLGVWGLRRATNELQGTKQIARSQPTSLLLWTDVRQMPLLSLWEGPVEVDVADPNSGWDAEQVDLTDEAENLIGTSGLSALERSLMRHVFVSGGTCASWADANGYTRCWTYKLKGSALEKIRRMVIWRKEQQRCA